MSDAFFLLPGAPKELPGTFQAAWTALHGVTVGRNRTRHVERVALERDTLFAKFFHGPRLADLLRNRFTAPRARSQAEREVRMAHALRSFGLSTVVPVAYGQRMLGPFERKSLLITREQPGPTLGERLRAAPDAMKIFSAPLGKLLGALFLHDFHLPDLSLEHILVAPEGDLVLLDLHNARRSRPKATRAGRMLGRLWAGARDTVPALLALRLATRALALRLDRDDRAVCLSCAARGATRWEARERRKRRDPGKRP